MTRLPDYRIIPLEASLDRSRFRCGVPELDDYFHHQVGQDLRRKVAAPFVLLDADGNLLGYYTLSGYSVALPQLPGPLIRKLPRYPRLPATLLGRLAVSQSSRGKNLGRLLLMDALHRSWQNTHTVASIGVVVDAISGAARSFYEHHEFIALADHPNRLFLAMGTIAKLFES